MKTAKRLREGLILLGDHFQKALEQAKARNYDKMSANDRVRALSDELADLKIGDYFSVVDLFDDSIIVRVYVYGEGDADLYRIPFTINDNSVAVFGQPIEVERITTYEPITDADDEATEGQAQEQKEVIQYQALSQSGPEILLSEISSLTFDAEVLEQAKKNQDTSKGLPFKNAVLTTFETPNSQGQWYPRSVWEKNLAQLQDKASKNMLVGEADHPENAPSVARNCIMFQEVWIDGNQVLGNGMILPTQLGKDLIAQAVAGIPIAVSSRGYGRVKLQDVNGKRLAVIQDDFRCVTFDAVHAPAAPGSYISGVEQSQTESTETLNQSVNEGDFTEMKIKELIAKLQGKLEILKEQGKDVSKVEADLNAVVQAMDLTGMSEDAAMTILAPFSTMLSPSGPFPGDPDKNKGVFNMTRQQNQVGGDEPKDLEENDDEAGKQAQAVEITQAQKEARDKTVTKLIQGYDEETQAMFQGLLEDALTTSAVVTKFEKVQQSVHKVLGITSVGGSVAFPSGVGQLEREKRYNNAPKNMEQAITHLSQGLKENIINGKRVKDGNDQRYQFELLAKNICETQPAALQAYLAMEQGRLLQDTTGAGVVADVVAGNATLLPIIRRTWSQLFLPEIASIQVLDRPAGYIHYMDSYNQDGADLNVNQHYYDYSDNTTEYASAKRVKNKITKRLIQVTGKKLKTTVSYEELQDSLAYYNIDMLEANLQLVAGQLAREINTRGLYEMATATGTSGNTDFGMDAPSAYTQTDWETQGLGTYLDKVMNDIFVNRQLEATHILGGPTAMIQLRKIGKKFGYIAGRGDEGSSLYEGINIFGTINEVIKCYKVQVFDQPWFQNKLLILRRGTEFTDAPYVLAPYTFAVEPPKHGIDGDFSVTQGMMARFATDVTVPQAMATLTFKSATTGTRI